MRNQKSNKGFSQTLSNTMNQIIYKVNDYIFKSQGVDIIGKTGPKDNPVRLPKQHPIIID